MRLKYVFSLGGALLLLGPAGAAGQTAVCDFLSSGVIEDRSWSEIQDYLDRLVDAFDKHPLVSDRQTLVKKGKSKQARGMALVAGSPAARSATEDRLALGCFVGLIESELNEPEVGAFQGRTFVWVDRAGPGGAWRSIHFPHDRAASLDATTAIAMPFLVPLDSGRTHGGFSPAGVNVVYRGQLYRGDLDGYDFNGARWIMRPPWGLFSVVPQMDRIEAMGCYRCDGTTCCPMDMQLSIF